MGDWDDAVEMGFEDLEGNILVDDYEPNATKSNTETIKIELTPSKYLDTSSRYLRAQLTNNTLTSDNIVIELFHDKYNDHDPMAIEVYCNKTFIGYVKKKRDMAEEDVDNFCFSKGSTLRNLTIIWKDNHFEISRKRLSLNENTEFSELAPYDPAGIQILWDWAVENNLPESVLPRNHEDLEELTELKIGEEDLDFIPEEIGCLHNLVKLSIWSNKIKLIPSSIGNLHKLTELTMEGSNLTGLPNTLGKLENLKHLYIDELTFPEFPKQICRLRNLETLMMKYTNFDSLPSELCNLNQLKRIVIRDRKLYKTDCFSWLVQLTKLEEINFFMEELESVPEEIFSHRQLKILYLYMPKVEEIPESIGNLSNLSKLCLCDNDKLKVLPNSIGNLINLTELNLGCLPLVNFPETLVNLTNLKLLIPPRGRNWPDWVPEWLNENDIKYRPY